MVIGQLLDPGGYLSTDVGGKVATLEAMSNGPTASPDLGYWAESADPDGSLFPMYSTQEVGEAWVNVTTLPMLYLALPLYGLGGVRLALLIPALGTVLAALAARALVSRLGGDLSQGVLAFWMVGLASPATIYGLSIWEHSLSLALMAWGVVAALDAAGLAPPRSDAVRTEWRSAAFAGLAFGLAASMRQEALVYGFVTGLALLGATFRPGRVYPALRNGAAMAVAAVSMLALNAALEVAVLGSAFRSGRSASTAAAAGSGSVGLAVRAKEAVLTGAGMSTAESAAGYLVALGLVVLLWLLGRRADDAPDATRPILVGLAILLGLKAIDTAVDGLNFVPGLIAATPLAGLGLARGWAGGARRFVTLIAVAAMPLVWMTQFTGGAGPQWGGRYILTSGLLLAVVAIVSLKSESAIRIGRLVLAGGLVVTMLGLAWSIERSSSFARAFSDLAGRDEPVLVFEDPFIAREGGPKVIEQNWLAAPSAEHRDIALTVLDSMDVDQFGYVEVLRKTNVVDFSGWTLVGVEEISLVGSDRLRISTWERTS